MDERVSSFGTPEFFEEQKLFLANLREGAKAIADLSNQLRGLEGFTLAAKSIREVSVNSSALVDVQGRLVSSTAQYNKVLADSEAFKARNNGTSKEVLVIGDKIVRIKQEEAKAEALVNKALQEGEKFRTQSAKTTLEQARASTEASKASLNEAKASTEAAKQREIERKYVESLTKAKERLIAKQEKEQAKLLQQQSALGRVKAEYKKAADAAEELGAQYFLLAREIEQLEAAQLKYTGLKPGNNIGMGDIAAKKLQLEQLAVSMNSAQASALKLHTGLLGIEQAVGKSQRNVGNYASSVFALSQVLREAPAFANSFQTGLSAISNNLPMLVDEFKKVKTAAGSTGAALKIFGSSLFSMGNLLPLAFTGVMLLVSAFSASAKETKAANAELTDFEKSINSISESVGKEVGSLSQLVATAQNVNLSYRERSEAVDELQKKMPITFGQMDREIILNGDISKAYDAVTASIIRKAEAQAKADIITKAIQERTKAQLELDAILTPQEGTFSYANNTEVERLEAVIKQKDILIDATKRQINIDNEAGAKTAYWIDHNAKKKFDADQAEQHRRAKMTEDQRRDEDKAANSAERQRVKDAKKAEKDLADRVKKSREIEAEILLERERDSLKAAMGKTKAEEDAAKELDRIWNENNRLAKKLGDEALKEYTERTKKQEAQQKQLQADYFQLAQDGTNIAQTLADLNSQLTQQRLNAIDEESRKMKERYDAEVEYINKALMTDKERADALSALNAKARSEEAEQNAKRREEMRRDAATHKAVNIAKIIVETALAVVHQLGSGDPYTATARAIAAGVLGASQLAVAAAAPLPAYAEGSGEDYVTGKALTDERGPEGYLTKSGKFYLGSDSGANVKHFTEPTKIIPNETLLELSRFYTLGLPRMVPQHGSSLNTASLEKKLDSVEKAIRNKKESTVNLTGFAMEHYTRLGGAQINYIHNILK